MVHDLLDGQALRRILLKHSRKEMLQVIRDVGPWLTFERELRVQNECSIELDIVFLHFLIWYGEWQLG